MIVALYVAYYRKDMLNVRFYELLSSNNIRYGLISSFNDYDSESLYRLGESVKELNRMFEFSKRNKTIAALVLDEIENYVKFTCIYGGKTPLKKIEYYYLDDKNIKIED